MNGSKTTETKLVPFTVTEADHEAGKFLSVPTGYVVVAVVEVVTTVEETVVRFELNGEVVEAEAEVSDKKVKKTK